jgi:hypothetical protein
VIIVTKISASRVFAAGNYGKLYGVRRNVVTEQGE